MNACIPAGFVRVVMVVAVAVASLVFGGCSTAPKSEDRATFIRDSRSATAWFEQNVSGLAKQLDESAGYVIYPAVGQWGIIFGGGQHGRGMVNTSDDVQVGWAALNTGSLGLQAGVRGFKMLVVFQDQATFDKFKRNQLSGSASAVAVAVENDASTAAHFENGVAIYQGASSGLIAGVNIGLNYMKFKGLDEE